MPIFYSAGGLRHRVREDFHFFVWLGRVVGFQVKAEIVRPAHIAVHAECHPDVGVVRPSGDFRDKLDIRVDMDLTLKLRNDWQMPDDTCQVSANTDLEERRIYARSPYSCSPGR